MKKQCPGCGYWFHDGATAHTCIGRNFEPLPPQYSYDVLLVLKEEQAA